MNLAAKKLLWKLDFATIDFAEFEKYWNYDLGDGSQHGLVGWGNNELEFYTKDSVLLGSTLKLSAARTDETKNFDCYYGKALWTSGKIHTANKVSFKYGQIDVKAKAPSGIGTWPAIWLLGNNLLAGTTWPGCGEIDILETTGANPYQIQGTIHGPGYSGESGLTKIIQHERLLSEDFHTYSINWMEDKLEWLFDGNVYHSITRDDVNKLGHEWPFNSEFYLILNLAIGGWFGGEVDPALKSATFEIESIQYYAIDGFGSVSFN